MAFISDFLCLIVILSRYFINYLILKSDWFLFLLLFSIFRYISLAYLVTHLTFSLYYQHPSLYFLIPYLSLIMIFFCPSYFVPILLSLQCFCSPSVFLMLSLFFHIFLFPSLSVSFSLSISFCFSSYMTPICSLFFYTFLIINLHIQSPLLCCFSPSYVSELKNRYTCNINIQ